MWSYIAGGLKALLPVVHSLGDHTRLYMYNQNGRKIKGCKMEGPPFAEWRSRFVKKHFQIVTNLALSKELQMR